MQIRIAILGLVVAGVLAGCDSKSQPDPCVPTCTGKQCGDDGCGGSCGGCQPDQLCDANHYCVCAPDCAGKECGDNGCGQTCGACPPGESCDPGGQCQPGCAPACDARECGDDGCQGSCGECGVGELCQANGQCMCAPDCTNKECGDDGCGGSCGDCLDCAGEPAPERCIVDRGWCEWQCCPDCTGQECGYDGCGGSCGTCAEGEQCSESGHCVEAPCCEGLECGPDPCLGRSCGTCGHAARCSPQGLCEPIETCPDLSGTYDITPYCLGENIGAVVIDQAGCAITFSLYAICTGRLDARLNLYVECGGLGFPCHGKASLTTPFWIVCSPQCSFILERLELGAACTYHRDPVCVATGELCGVVVDDVVLATRCVRILPGGREPGAYCDEEAGLLCANSLCVDHACGAVCVDDLDCAGYLGTSCQDVPYTLEGVTGSIRSCTPVNAGETACRRTPDCAPSRVCSFRPTLDDVLAVCLQPNPDGAPAGLACTQGSECETGLCLCGAELCTGGNEGRCSELCLDSLDCVQGSECGLVMVQDLGGGAHELTACVRDPDPDACGRNADCPAGRSCQVFLDADGLSLVTECQYGSGPGHDNTGEACAGPTDCFSVWCGNWGYCLGVCVSDADCPTFDTATACGADATCELGTLCEAGLCRRVFGCTTYAFYLGDDASGQPVYDTTNLCMPERRPCALDADCRAGEACRLDANSTATAAVYVCDAGGPGTGQLGANCEAGEEVCWSGHCLIEGEGGPGLEYCTRACVTDADCEPTDTYSCQAIRVDVRPGFVSYLPACARR
ncbi:MAG TPA: hypothetical protein P5147_19195 [Myxococcota bacterium]|nr:hypothetical protein [Myxococcota bacterium]